MSGHVSPVSTYLAIFGALMLGTILTVVAAFIDFPASLNFPIALAIAVTKATLVILFFMHVKYSSRLVKLIVGIAFFFLGIMLTLTMTDYLSRGWFTAPEGSTSAASITSLTGARTPSALPAQEPPPAGPAQNTSPK
jgi:cytochrome c oxidase subunit 4